MQPKRVNFQVLGCRLNEAEIQQWAGDFQRAGYAITGDAARADLLVVNTCAVTGEAARKSRQMIRRAQRNNPQARLVVSGCYATLEQQQAAALEGVDLVVPNTEKDRLAERVQQELLADAMPVLAQRPAETAVFQRGRSRAFIKVQDGCRWRCTYCIVTTARGEERSRPVAAIIDEINTHAGAGVREVVLSGVHLGGYGSDTGSDLFRLTEMILAETDIPRIRFGSLEPWDIPEGFFGLFEDPRVMPHLHLPLQSGADTVLKRMARRCSQADFSRLLEQARATIPDFNVSTDIIVGFPGESEEEWQQGLAFIEQCGFGHVHIFPFSAREGTKAARLPGRVEKAVIRQRVAGLKALAEQMKQTYEAGFKDRVLDVLFEDSPQESEQGLIWFGYTPNYLRVRYLTDKDADMGNRIFPVCLGEVREAAKAITAKPMSV